MAAATKSVIEPDGSSEISFWLNEYDDLFSDFDHRPHSHRAISDDFLTEAKRFSWEKTSGNIELRFFIPGSKRQKSLEHVIRKRLHDHFKSRYAFLKKEKQKALRRAILLTSAGVAFMVGASYISIKSGSRTWFHILRIILEPGGWFMTWFGLEALFFTPVHQETNWEFYRKMSNCEIVFNNKNGPLSGSRKA